MKTKIISLAVIRNFHRTKSELVLKHVAKHTSGNCAQCYCYKHRTQTMQTYYGNSCDDVIKQTGNCDMDYGEHILWMCYKLIRKNYPMKSKKDC